MDKNVPPKNIEAIRQELSGIRKEVYSELLLCGGEILLRQDLFEIIKLATSFGFRVWIESNGRLLADAGLAKRLLKAKVSGFFVDLYSHDEKLHNYATGQKLSFKETINGLSNIKQLGFGIVVKLIIIRENYKGLAQTIEFLAGHNIKKIQLYFPESIPEAYSELEELVPKIPESLPYINMALNKAAELKVEIVPRFTPFSRLAYTSAWVKKGRKTGKKAGHELLYDNGINLKKQPLLSVVIPTFNRSNILQNTLASLLNQTLAPKLFEVIVVDDGSTDDSFDKVRKLKPNFRLRYILQDDLGYGPGRARNIGTLFAEGEIVLFLDADVISDPHNLEEHLKTHAFYKRQYGHDAFVIGKRLDMHINSKIQKLLTPENIINDFGIIRRIPARPDMREDFYKWCNDEPGNFSTPWHMVYTNNVSVRRRHLINAGLIDESFVFWGIEDQELGYRLQWLRFVLNSKAIGYHQHHDLSYSDTQGLSKALKYNSRIFYKKYLDPLLFETYKASFYHNSFCLQLTPNTINKSQVFKYIKRQPKTQLSFSEVSKQIALYAGEGCDEAELIGGNPLLHPDFWQILEMLKGFKAIKIDTEADSLAELSTCLKLLNAGVTSFVFTYGGRHSHAQLLGGSAKLAIKAIKNLVLLNQSLKLRLIVSKQNFPLLEAEVEQLASLGVKQIEFNLALGEHRLLFDESSIPLSGLLYYHIFRALKLAKAKGIRVSTRNVFSDFLGLNANIFLRLYELYGKPIAVSRDELR